MKKITRLLLLACIILLFFVVNTFAVEVDEQEIKSVGKDPIVFINYTGPHKIINTIEEIKNIGHSAARRNKGKIQGETTDGKYTVIRAIDPTTKEGLNADILVLTPNAGVDHIVNLRRIISAYLETAWDYSEADANTIATYVTVYNAVYRGNIETFNKRYKEIVTKHLKKDIVGLSTNYQDWPGKTQIVIPISDPGAGLGTIDTSVISDKKVIDNMREEEDRSVDTRKEMVDIKEREADIANKKAQDAQKAATTAKKEADEASKKAQEDTQKQQVARKEAEEAKKVAQENPDDIAAQQKAKDAEKTAQEAEKKAEESKTVAKEKTEKADELTKKATEEQAESDKKRLEAQTERTEIAKDQQQNLADAKKSESMKTAYGLKLNSGITDMAEILSTLVKINADNGDIVKTSPVTVIRNRTVYNTGNSFVAIAGKTIVDPNSNQAIKLVSLDQNNMEIQIESEEIVSPLSVLVEDAGLYYCVIKDNTNWVVGKYNKDMKLLAKTNEVVLQQTPILINDNTVSVTKYNGMIIILNKSDLKSITVDNTVDAK